MGGCHVQVIWWGATAGVARWGAIAGCHVWVPRVGQGGVSWRGIIAGCCLVCGCHVELLLFISHTVHVWYIYLHLVDFYGKCR